MKQQQSQAAKGKLTFNQILVGQIIYQIKINHLKIDAQTSFLPQPLAPYAVFTDCLNGGVKQYLTNAEGGSFLYDCCFIHIVLIFSIIENKIIIFFFFNHYY